LQRAKNANAQPTHPGEYLSSFVRHFINKSLLSTQTHPAPSGQNSYELPLKHEQNNHYQQPRSGPIVYFVELILKIILILFGCLRELAQVCNLSTKK
jgi:hypothetical protein